tara:strand:+ start:9973 stop:10317 length:345 start_codon:yes stop_codon:yes gene_type:complete
MDNIDEVLEELISTIERNSFDNKATIGNVKLWAKSWRREAKELKSDLLNPVSKRLSIKLEDWHHQCGDGCCDMYGTEIALNGKKCDNQCAGDDVRAALEFVLTELGYEVDVDVY